MPAKRIPCEAVDFRLKHRPGCRQGGRTCRSERVGPTFGFCVEICIVIAMTVFAAAPHAVSVTEAATRGVSSLVRAAEHGEDVVVERHGKAVAAIVSMAHLEEISRLEHDLRESVLLLARVATDTGARTDLDAAIEALGLDRAELEADLADDLAAGRE